MAPGARLESAYAASLAAKKKDAKERQREHGGTAPGRKKTLRKQISQVISATREAAKVTTQRAKAAGIAIQAEDAGPCVGPSVDAFLSEWKQRLPIGADRPVFLPS